MYTPEYKFALQLSIQIENHVVSYLNIKAVFMNIK